ncbi:MAG: UDP-3-O-(3-hydroxymyristoyl)glucosamine N-acyltransferase [Bacteroidota bacterium]
MRFKEPIALKELAALEDAEFSGDARFPVSGINEIHQVEKGDVTFVDHPKYFRKALTSSASVIIVNSREIENPLEKMLIFSDDPFRDYNRLVRHFYSFKVSSGLISESARIGDGTVIQPNVFIGDHVIIGNDCIIHPNVTIYDNCQIGNNVIIHANTVIGSDAFYFQRKPEEFRKMNSCGRVIVEDNVEIGSNCSVDRGVSGDTVIGWGTKMDNLIQIGHDTVIGKNCLIASQVGVAGCVIIEDDVILWGQVGVHKDLTIGKGAVVLAKSGVPKSLEGDKVYFGSPVQESREKMKELAYIKRIPDLLKLLSEKDAG